MRHHFHDFRRGHRGSERHDVAAFNVSMDKTVAQSHIQHVKDLTFDAGIQAGVIHPTTVLVLNRVGINIVRQNRIGNAVVIHAGFESPVLGERTVPREIDATGAFRF